MNNVLYIERLANPNDRPLNYRQRELMFWLEVIAINKTKSLAEPKKAK